MKITLDKTSSMFGLTAKNLKLPAMQCFLRKQGITVTYPDFEHVMLESEGGAFFNSSFQQQVKKIEADAIRFAAIPPINTTNGTETSKTNQISWSVLNGFLAVLGTAAIATVFAILASASPIVIAGISIIAGVTGLLAYSLFHACSESNPDMSIDIQPQSRLVGTQDTCLNMASLP